jgi:hypothetical protein
MLQLFTKLSDPPNIDYENWISNLQRNKDIKYEIQVYRETCETLAKEYDLPLDIHKLIFYFVCCGIYPIRDAEYWDNDVIFFMENWIEDERLRRYSNTFDRLHENMVCSIIDWIPTIVELKIHGIEAVTPKKLDDMKKLGEERCRMLNLQDNLLDHLLDHDVIDRVGNYKKFDSNGNFVEKYEEIDNTPNDFFAKLSHCIPQPKPELNSELGLETKYFLNGICRSFLGLVLTESQVKNIEKCEIRFNEWAINYTLENSFEFYGSDGFKYKTYYNNGYKFVPIESLCFNCVAIHVTWKVLPKDTNILILGIDQELLSSIELNSVNHWSVFYANKGKENEITISGGSCRYVNIHDIYDI